MDGSALLVSAAVGLALAIAVCATKFPTRHMEDVRPARKGFVRRV